MIDEHESLLERVIDRELKKLPELTAPDSLIPRVLATIRAHAKPWWQRSWATWPWWWRVAFLALTLALLGAVTFGVPEALGGLSLQPLVAKVNVLVDSLAPLWKPFAALGNACLVLVRSGGQLLLWSLVAVSLVAYLTCVGLGTLCYRVAFNKI
jgi:hypothetical protein